MPSDLEKRSDPRVAFTHINTGTQRLGAAPGWPFDAATQRPHGQAWVLDMSCSGMQVLAPARSPKRSRDMVYDVLVLAGYGPATRFQARARWVWSREVAHLGQLNGFEFESPQPRAAALLAGHQRKRGQARSWPVCQLVQPAQPQSLSVSMWAWARKALGSPQTRGSGAAHETH